jgi:hypothetical protein
MTRQSRDFLEPLTSSVKRKKFCVYDIESKADDTQDAGFTRPFLVGTYDSTEDEYVEFRNLAHLSNRDWWERHILPGGCIDQLLNYLLSPRFNGYNIYAHNGGSFDHLFLLAWLTAHRDEFGFEVVPVQSSIQKIDVWRHPEHADEKPKEKWTFLDSMKLLPMGLERACKTFGLPGKVTHDLNMEENDPHWSEYLQQDCFALSEVLNKAHDLIETVLGGEVGMTTPATSMKLFRRQFLGRGGAPSRIPRFAHWPECKNRRATKHGPAECPGCFHEWVRRAYYGGRTELFKTYGEGLHYYDINSSYVAAMRETMPAGNREVTDHLDWRRHEHFVGFVECTVRIPEDCYLPPLPHRDEETGKLIFPVGMFTGVWDCEELKLLEHPSVRGEIVHVQKVVWFKRQHLFVDMVDKLYGLRDKNRADYDEGLSALAKLLGNGLYGKFGMKQDRTTVVFAKEVADEKTMCFLCGKTKKETEFVCRECDGSTPANGDPTASVWYQKKHVDAPYIIPQIAAHITTLARVRLWRFMRMALDAGGKLFYSDTDSIITDAVLPSSAALGELKDEYPGIADLRGAFVQPKVYMVETEDGFPEKDDEGKLKPKEEWKHSKVTMKGFPPKMRTKENLAKLIDGETLEWERLQKVRSLARGSFKHSPRMDKVSKSFKSTYDKRLVVGNGDTRAKVLFEEPLWLKNMDKAAE